MFCIAHLLHGLYYASCFIKHPSLNFSPKVYNKRPGLSQVLRVSVHENQGNVDCFEKVPIKRSALISISNSRSLKRLGLITDSIEYRPQCRTNIQCLSFEQGIPQYSRQ